MIHELDLETVAHDPVSRRRQAAENRDASQNSTDDEVYERRDQAFVQRRRLKLEPCFRFSHVCLVSPPPSATRARARCARVPRAYPLHSR